MSKPPVSADAPVQRVLHVLNYGWPHIDGYTVRSSGLITAQAQHLGLDVTVATSPFAPLTRAADRQFQTEAWHPGAQIHAARHRSDDDRVAEIKRFERPGIGLAPATQREFRAELASIVRRLSPDLIHVHHPHYVASVAIDVARAFDLPCVYELRCFNGDYDLGLASRYANLRGQLFNRHEAAVCRAADAVVTISDGLAGRIINTGVARERVFVVRNSVDTQRFSSGSRPSPYGTSRVRMGYACTFSPMEGLDLLVDAAANLSPQLRNRLEIVIAGDGADRERIEARIAERGLEATVKLPGFIPYGDMPDFYRGLDLFVVPRRDTPVAAATTPLKPLEARAAGVPMLVSDLPALRELLGDNAPDVRFVSPQAEALGRALAGFMHEPWSGASVGDHERSWSREVMRYRTVYATAQAIKSPNADRTTRIERANTTLRRVGRRAARRVVDSPLPGTTPLACHAVVCGFPRTGSTMLQMMIAAAVPDVRVFDGEIEAVWAARHALRNHRWMLTKNPRDIDTIDAVREFYSRRSAKAHFVVMLRDPRAVLTSKHAAYPSSRGYYVSFERWRRIYRRFRALAAAKDITTLRYEDLVVAPDRIQAQLEADIGWGRRAEFADYDRAVQKQALARDSMTEGALGGLRAVESSRIEQWRRSEHAPRIRAMLEAIPQMPDYLIELGYETDDAWRHDIV
ncbi:glycosyltransferase [Salinisphaera japonica]|uniref:glycosyltransferase n=1 Tax=Salinisphaera japonica TaxID=1304270 RepID=UPI000F4B14D1|nr:glycosyltransferase [Salinisphaera japonica]